MQLLLAILRMLEMCIRDRDLLGPGLLFRGQVALQDAATVRQRPAIVEWDFPGVKGLLGLEEDGGPLQIPGAGVRRENCPHADQLEQDEPKCQEHPGQQGHGAEQIPPEQTIETALFLSLIHIRPRRLGNRC